MKLKTVLLIIAEILSVLGNRIPISRAISMVSKKHNLSENTAWEIWKKHGNS